MISLRYYENYRRYSFLLLQNCDFICPKRLFHISLGKCQDSRLQQCYNLLGLDSDASIDDVKVRFSHLAKQYHPDTGKEDADGTKMEELHSAYKYILKAQENSYGEPIYEQTSEGEDKFDIKHTAPQHRQYLEYGGVGRGKPSARQKQYQQYRVGRAVENAQEFMIDKAIRESYNEDSEKTALILKKREQNYFSKKHKVTGMIERVVEDLILSSMANGEFQNLKGAGKPIKYDLSNPYIDDTERRINDLLKAQGFTPPWIMKATEIREYIDEVRSKLRSEYARFILSQKPPYNDSITFSQALTRWESTEEKVEALISTANKKIEEYNLITPLKNHCYFFKMDFNRERENARKEIDENVDNSNKFVEDARKVLSREKKYTPSLSHPNFLSRLVDFTRSSYKRKAPT